MVCDHCWGPEQCLLLSIQQEVKSDPGLVTRCQVHGKRPKWQGAPAEGGAIGLCKEEIALLGRAQLVAGVRAWGQSDGTGWT